MSNAKTIGSSHEELSQFSEHMRELPLIGPVPDWTPRYRIGPKQYGLIIRGSGDEQVDSIRWSRAQWGLIPAKALQPLKGPMTHARDDKLVTGWPWKMISKRQRCLVIADGFYEAEKPARSKERAPWSYYQMRDRRLFAMAGLWQDAIDVKTGELIDTYTVVTTKPCPAIRVHDRMPVILDESDYRRWLQPGDVPVDLTRPYQGGDLEGWRVGDAARSPRSPDHPGLIDRVDETPTSRQQLDLGL